MSNTDNYDNYKKSLYKASRLAEAENEMYMDMAYSVNPGHFDTENLGDCTKETMHYHKNPEPFDNNSYIVDQVVDDRILKNHMEWVNEVTPYAGTASMIGADEFNPGDYLDWRGLRRPRGVEQIDPWQVTEVTETDLSDNKPFMI
jgi:hypothetical protein